MQTLQPNEAHRKLEKLAGDWIGKERIHPSPFDPQGGEAVGRVHNRVALDGFVIVQDYEQERGGKVNFRGHGVFSWDAAEQCYMMHWWDSMGMPLNLFRGEFEGDVLTLDCRLPADDELGRHSQSRAVFDFTAADRYRFRMEVSPNGKQWFPFMEAEYQRQKA
jgi:hypothetical protein